MADGAAESINQSILAERLGSSVPEALDLLAARGWWDNVGSGPTSLALRDGLATVVDHPLTGKVTMWSPRVVELLDGRSLAPLPSREDPTVTRAGSAPTDGDNGPCRIFVASSIDEFRTERPQIAGILHSVDKRYLVYLAEFDPDGDSQDVINRHLTSSDYFVAIMGRRLGKKTALEIDLALERFRQSGTPRVKFFIQKFADNEAQRSPEVEKFARELWEEGVHYPREFADEKELLDQVELFFRRLRR